MHPHGFLFWEEIRWEWQIVIKEAAKKISGK